MGSLGSLNVDLSAEIAQFVGAMDRAAYASEKTGKKIEESIGNAERQMKSFAVGTIAAFASFQTVDYFGKLISGSIDAMAALDDMAERTGNSVEQLSGLVQVAKVGGHDIGVMEQAITKLAKGMLAADEETKGVGAALKFLNVQAKDASGNLRPTGDLMLEIAGKLDKYADGTGKAAIAQTLFGKSGAAVLPFMKDLAEQGAIVGKVTAEQAAQAETYQKTLAKLAVAKEDLVRVITTSVLPVMQAVADIMLRSKTATDGSLESAKKLAADGSIASWAEKAAYSAAFVIDAFSGVITMSKAVGVVFATGLASAGAYFTGIADMAAKAKNFDIGGAFQAGEDARKRIGAIQADARKDIEAIYLGHRSVRFELETQLGVVKELAAKTGAAAGGGSTGKPALKFGLPDEGEMKKARAEADQLQALLDKIFNKQVGLESGYTKDLRLLQEQFEKGNIPTTEEYVAAVEALIQQQPFYIKGREESAKADIEAAKAMTELKKRFDDAVTDTRKMVEGMEFELEAMKLTNTEREIAIRLRDMEQKGVVKGSAAYEEYALRIRAAVEAKDGLQGQIDLFKSIEDVAHQTWQSVTNGGKGAAERIRDAFKNGVYELLYQLTIKPFYINVVANLTGQGGTGGAVANALGGGTSGLGSIGNVLGTVGSLFAGSSAAYAAAVPGLASFGAGSQAAMLAAQTGAFGTAGLTSTAAAAGGTAAGGSVLGSLSALGPYAAVALAVYALYKAFAKPGGGPKEGGSFVGTYDPTGALQSSQLGTLFGVSTQNDSLATIGNQTSKSYYDLLKQLGGTAAPMVSFGLGYDSDPRGTAQNRIKSNVSIGGKSIYNVMDREFGRDNSQIGPQLQLEASRMLLVALQNSSLPPALTKVFNSVTAASATQEQIDAVMKSAQALKGMFDSFEQNPIEDAARQIEDGQNSMASAVRRNSEALQKLIDQYDGSAAAAESLAGATSQYYLAQVSLLAQFEEIRRAVTGMFDQTLRTIELAGLDKQQQYDFYQKEADAFLASLLGSSDVNEIQRLAEKINSDINAAFGLLSPDEQRRESGSFLERGRETQRLIDEQIQKAVKESSDRTRADMDLVREALLKGTEPLAAAATKFDDAATTFAGAVSGGININVNVPLETGS